MKHFNPAALREAREQAGLSKPQLAKRAALSLDTVYCLEDEATERSPRDGVVGKLASALGVDWAVFYAPTNRETETQAAS